MKLKALRHALCLSLLTVSCTGLADNRVVTVIDANDYLASIASEGGAPETYDDLITSLSPTHYWKMDALSGSLTDSVGGNNPSLSGSATYSVDALHSGSSSSISINDESSYFNAGKPISSIGDFSFMAWVRWDGAPTSAARHFFANNDHPGELGRFGIGTTGTGAAKLYINDEDGSGDDYLLLEGPNILDGSTYFVSATREGDTFTLYINGAQADQATQPGITVDQSRSMYIFRAVTSNHYWNGTMDSIVIMNRAATAQEISDIYSKGTE